MKNLESSFWSIFAPHDVNYFCLPVYDHFGHRSFHVRTVRQEWDMKRFREDLAARLIRSEVQFDPERPSDRPEQIRRLLFRLAEDVFCELDKSELTVYALSWAQAVDFAEQLAGKYGKAKPTEQPFFYLLRVAHGEVEAERVKISRPCLLNESDLALHYGPDAVDFERMLIESLQGQIGGTTVLRGEPGTGKTSFVRVASASVREG
jgi:hypothetical protein